MWQADDVARRRPQPEEYPDGIFDKAKEAAEEHADKIEDGIDKVAEAIDDKTGGKHADKIAGGAEKAKDALGSFTSKTDKP